MLNGESGDFRHLKGVDVRSALDTDMNRADMVRQIDPSFEGKRVALIGAGVSNLPLVGFLNGLGARVTVRELRDESQLGETADKIRAAGGELIAGPDYLSGMNEDIIIRSPGIRPDTKELETAARHGASVWCEMELFARNAPCPVFAVTGSDGKSTTTTILSKLINVEGKVYLGGNIGEPLFHRTVEMNSNDAAAIELSSFQLMTMDAPFESAVITNVTPNHLNWHTGMDEYADAKRNILRRARRAVLNYDNEVTRKMGEDLISSGKTPVVWFSLSPIPDSTLSSAEYAVFLDGDDIFKAYPDGSREALLKRQNIVLPGMHNTANYMAAYAAAADYTNPEILRKVAGSFTGVRHRLQLVSEGGGVRYYNSSIDSSPTRTAAAISALCDTSPERGIIIICGGYDKKIPFEPLAEAILGCKSIREVVLTGATRDKIYEAIVTCARRRERSSDISICIEENFDDAVRRASNDAVSGESVLLSPACASFDAFANFEERGKRFTALACELAKSKN